MGDGERRKAANEAVFREVNERIESLQHRFALTAHEPLRIVCECDRLDCVTRLGVAVEVYERVRADPACFLVAPGHEDEAVETVVDSVGDALIVRKRLGDPRRVAETTDPRS
jgi:hypothetical protein